MPIPVDFGGRVTKDDITLPIDDTYDAQISLNNTEEINMKTIKKLLALSIVAITLILILCGCGKNEMKEYYSDEENYIFTTGTVSFLAVRDMDGMLYIEFNNLSEEYEDNCFKITGKNYEIIRENGLIEKLPIGRLVQFTTAPERFSDGYILPIVSISVEGEEYLSFDEGVSNLLDELK